MKKLTAIILCVCLGAAGLTGCQAGASGTSAASGASDAPVASTAPSQAAKTTTQQEDKEGNTGGTVIITDHTGIQVEIPGEVNRVVVTDILPLPSIITVFLGSGEKIVGMAPASMSAARTGLLGELLPDILNASTDFMNGSDITWKSL